MDALSPSALAAILTTRRLGRAAVFHAYIGSTNDAAKALARAGAVDGLLVFAEMQTAGRGRLNRAWWAPACSSLLMSLVLRAPISLRRAGQLTMCLGLGACEGIEQTTGVQAGLKWPNDLVLAGRKLGGMLSEVEADGDTIAWAVLGLGLNVNIPFGAAGQATPQDLRDTATSLADATGAAVDRLALVSAILARTEVWYDRVTAGELVHDAWRQRLVTLGSRVRVSSPTSELEGVATGVTPEGGLLLRDDSGAQHTIWSGDVTTVRPVSAT